jgi:two-component system response regulator HydG
MFEAADGGTLFLDEVAELPLPLQPKLLRAIESGEVRRVGETRAREVDVRIVAATQRDLAQSVEAGAFREDLFWRINVLHLDVPPLRERAADIPLIVERFLADVGQRTGGPPARLAPAALAALVEFHWPGNVRQLLNSLERAVAFADGPRVDVDDLPDDVRSARRSAAIVRRAADREATLAELERDYILEVLARAGGNKTRAAEILGIPRRTLYRRLEEYGDSGD